MTTPATCARRPSITPSFSVHIRVVPLRLEYSDSVCRIARRQPVAKQQERKNQHAAGRRWLYLVVDEGHRLKNATCKLAVTLRAFKADGRLLLTGRAATI